MTPSSYTRGIPIRTQYLLSVSIVMLVASVCFATSEWIGYKVVALLLLMVVSVLAMLFDILPVLSAAVLSALVWNFFFIPPLFTFHINNLEDAIMFLLYFVVALVHAILTFKIRKAEQLARDREEQEKSIQLYNTLLSSLSHELRTPIATIIGSVDALKDSTNYSAQSKEMLLSEIDHAAMRLNRQVENLLNMSRLESAMLKPRLDWCDVNEVVFAVIQKLPEAGIQRVVFEPDNNLPLFKLDQGLLDQVLYNLLHNAILYTPEDAPVTITATYQNEACVLTVADKGPGFPESEISKVFDKFYRLPNSKAGGSGLGLAIVQGYVDALSGTVSLRNHPKGGAIVECIFPAQTTFITSLKHE